MLKNILKTTDAKVISKKEQSKIDGGGLLIDPSNVMYCSTNRHCQGNINGNCTCSGGRCVQGPRYCA